VNSAWDRNLQNQGEFEISRTETTVKAFLLILLGSKTAFHSSGMVPVSTRTGIGVALSMLGLKRNWGISRVADCGVQARKEAHCHDNRHASSYAHNIVACALRQVSRAPKLGHLHRGGGPNRTPTDARPNASKGVGRCWCSVQKSTLFHPAPFYPQPEVRA